MDVDFNLSVWWSKHDNRIKQIELQWQRVTDLKFILFFHLFIFYFLVMQRYMFKLSYLNV